MVRFPELQLAFCSSLFDPVVRRFGVAIADQLLIGHDPVSQAAAQRFPLS